jgi:hypothetical protein
VRVLVQERTGTSERSDVGDASVRSNNIVVVREDVPQTNSDQLGDFLVLINRRRFVLAPHVFERGFGPRFECRRALAPASETTQVFQVAVHRQAFLEELLHSRMEAREQR